MVKFEYMILKLIEFLYKSYPFSFEQKQAQHVEDSGGGGEGSRTRPRTSFGHKMSRSFHAMTTDLHSLPSHNPKNRQNLFLWAHTHQFWSSDQGSQLTFASWRALYRKIWDEFPCADERFLFLPFFLAMEWAKARFRWRLLNLELTRSSTRTCVLPRGEGHVRSKGQSGRTCQTTWRM